MITSASDGGTTYSEEHAAQATDNTGEVRDDATDEIQQTTEQSHFKSSFLWFRCPSGLAPGLLRLRSHPSPRQPEDEIKSNALAAVMA
ncbi:hypothetical protein GCM10011588_48060 [Nocardia jinanensis]|uniref:Uncharacterized protein n=1 Tax=Nocardia jinanensis TaxID=382504 RepID=A0A917RTB2_9NOCA|nr:hypothetical protein GCM10011588_48060 [Nocardia jinanensis]